MHDKLTAVEADLAEEDVEWAKRIDRRILVALLLVSALAWGAYGWLMARPMHPLLLAETIIVGSCIANLTAFAFAIPVRGVLYFASARYRRSKQYERACKRVRGRWRRKR